MYQKKERNLLKESFHRVFTLPIEFVSTYLSHSWYGPVGGVGEIEEGGWYHRGEERRMGRDPIPLRLPPILRPPGGPPVEYYVEGGRVW